MEGLHRGLYQNSFVKNLFAEKYDIFILGVITWELYGKGSHQPKSPDCICNFAIGLHKGSWVKCFQRCSRANNSDWAVSFLGYLRSKIILGEAREAGAASQLTIFDLTKPICDMHVQAWVEQEKLHSELVEVELIKRRVAILVYNTSFFHA